MRRGAKDCEGSWRTCETSRSSAHWQAGEMNAMKLDSSSLMNLYLRLDIPGITLINQSVQILEFTLNVSLMCLKGLTIEYLVAMFFYDIFLPPNNYFFSDWAVRNSFARPPAVWRSYQRIHWQSERWQTNLDPTSFENQANLPWKIWWVSVWSSWLPCLRTILIIPISIKSVKFLREAS